MSFWTHPWNPLAILLMRSQDSIDESRLREAKRLSLHHFNRAVSAMDEFEREIALHEMYEARALRVPMSHSSGDVDDLAQRVGLLSIPEVGKSPRG